MQQRVVFLVIQWRAGSYLRRRFFDKKSQQGDRFKLFFIRSRIPVFGRPVSGIREPQLAPPSIVS
jgi:hypothetical protein